MGQAEMVGEQLLGNHNNYMVIMRLEAVILPNTARPVRC